MMLSLLCLVASADQLQSLSGDAMEELEELLGDRHSACSQFEGFVKEKGISEAAALAGLRSVITNLAGNTNEIASSKRTRAIWCLRTLHSAEAFEYAEQLVETEERKWAPTIVFRDLAFQDEQRLPRLTRLMNTKPTPLFNFWIYESVRDELQTTTPRRDRQTRLVRFLLDRALVETADAIQLDEILCREVPKWRASPQRAENATKMICEHPNDARLVSFFETVRTNALESARAALPSEGEDADSPATTNQTSRTSASSVGSDPWADLLDNLPEKKPWTPPPGYEHPF